MIEAAERHADAQVTRQEFYDAWQTAKFVPRLGFRANVTSGDKDRNDPDSQTFSPLFPGTAYSGRIGLIGPSNVIDTTPTLRLRLHPRRQWIVRLRVSLEFRISIDGDDDDFRPIVVSDDDFPVRLRVSDDVPPVVFDIGGRTRS